MDIKSREEFSHCNETTLYQEDKTKNSNLENLNKQKKKSALDRSKLKNIDIVFLDDSDINARVEKNEVSERERISILTAYQRIQVSFLLCLIITNLIVYTVAFNARK